MKPTENDTVLTVSSIKDYLSCRQKHEFRHLQLYVPKVESDALVIGTATHQGLYLFYSKHNEKQVLDAIRSHFEKLMDGFTVEADIERAELSKAIVTAMLVGYMYHHKADEFGIIKPESEFLIPWWYPEGFVPPSPNGDPLDAKVWETAERRIWFAGKMDGVINVDGHWWLLEHKTFGDNDIERYKRKLYMDIQSTAYVMAAEYKYGIPIHGVYYNLLKKPLIKQRAKESSNDFCERLKLDYMNRSEFYFKRHMVYRNPDEREIFRSDSLEIAKSMIGGRVYRNTESCNVFGPCPYLKVCMNPKDQETTLEMGYKKSKKFPELELELGVTE